jgi:hypothetical protein
MLPLRSRSPTSTTTTNARAQVRANRELTVLGRIYQYAARWVRRHRLPHPEEAAHPRDHHRMDVKAAARVGVDQTTAPAADERHALPRRARQACDGARIQERMAAHDGEMGGRRPPDSGSSIYAQRARAPRSPTNAHASCSTTRTCARGVRSYQACRRSTRRAEIFTRAAFIHRRPRARSV